MELCQIEIQFDTAPLSMAGELANQCLDDF